MLKILSFLLLLTTYGLAQENAVAMKGVKIKLFSEVESIKPGDKFTIAIYIQHFDGFHTYWKNPGKVGVATKMDWQMPEGFKVTGVDWQVPQRSKMLMYNCHGYKGDTYILANIQTPKEIPENFSIHATVGGMSCSTKTCCFVGYAKAQIKLKRGAATTFIPENHQRIEKARQSIPKLKKDNDHTFKQDVENITLTLKGAFLQKPAAGEVYFFPEQNVYDTQVKQELTFSQGQLVVKMKLNEIADKDLKMITGFLYAEKGWASTSEKYLRVEAKVAAD
jgi:DsbC/DsbD-like thiol-disulfide interchange protein